MLEWAIATFVSSGLIAAAVSFCYTLFGEEMCFVILIRNPLATAWTAIAGARFLSEIFPYSQCHDVEWQSADLSYGRQRR